MVSVDISVEFDGLDRVKDDLERVQGAIEPPKLTESLGLGADIYVSAARSFAPKGETLALAASIGKVQIGPAEWEVSPFVNFPERVYLYAATQETGQVHHPVYADFMTFQGRAGWVRARSVDIPGTHYMELARGAADIKGDINRKLVTVPPWKIRVWVQELTGDELEEQKMPMYERDGAGLKVTLKEQNLRLCALAMRHENGSRLYPNTKAGIAILGKLGSGGSEIVAAVANELNKQSAEDVQKIAGNSEADQTSSWSAGSLSPSDALDGNS